MPLAEATEVRRRERLAASASAAAVSSLPLLASHLLAVADADGSGALVAPGDGILVVCYWAAATGGRRRQRRAECRSEWQ